MAFSFGGSAERLAFVLSLDSSAAIREFRKVGDTAEKELGKVDNRLDRMGGRMQIAGVGMMAFAAVAGRGLFALAKASEEANLATVKLDNAIANSPKLAGESADQFVELAKSIQGYSAADADAIVDAQAMLATFRLTSDELKQATPLVVDYARRFGVDLHQAAVQVGKAISGNAATLERNGVLIDDNAFAADHFSAVMSALRENAGGFARVEGETFAGSLERLKNQLGDLAEGVGAGVVDALTDMFSIIESGTDLIGNLSDDTLATTGRFATWGTVAIGAAGAASFLTGQVIKARDNFHQLGEMLHLTETGLGRVKAGFGAVGVAASLVALAEITNSFKDLKTEMSEVARLTDDELVEAFKKWRIEGGVMQDFLDSFSGAHADADQWIDDFTKLAETGSATAQRLRDAWAASGEASRGELAAMDEIIRRAGKGNQQLAADTEATAAASAGAVGPLSDVADAADEVGQKMLTAAEAHQEWTDTLRATIDPLFAMADALGDNQEAQLKLREATADYDEALAGLNERQASGTATQAELDAASRTLTEAELGLAEANRNVATSALDVTVAAADLEAGMEAGTVSMDQARAMLSNWVAQGLLTADQAAVVAVQLQGVATRAGEIPDDVGILVTADTGGAVADLDSVSERVRTINSSGQLVLIGTGHALGPAGIAIAAKGGILDTPTVLAAEAGFREAFIPESGISRARAHDLLTVAAAWHGFGLTSMAQGGVYGPHLPITVTADKESMLAQLAPILYPGVGVPGMMAAVRQAFPGLALLSGYRPGAITATGNRSMHGMMGVTGPGRATDLPPRMDVFNWFAANYPWMKELIFTPAGGRQIHNGSPHVYSEPTRSMHVGHVHAGMVEGGILGSGGTAQQVHETINVVVDGAVLAQTQRRYDRYNR